MNADRPAEITTRNDIARDIIAGFAAVTPTLAGVFRLIDTALADLPAVLADLGRARAELEAVRLDRANLLAAIRATLAADAEGEPDPLGYLRDELDSDRRPGRDEAAGMSTYRQIRRQTRRARKAGLQPIVVIDSPFPVPAAVLLARLAWRYRSEIAPATTAGAVLAAGWWLHHGAPGLVGVAARRLRPGRVRARRVRRARSACPGSPNGSTRLRPCSRRAGGSRSPRCSARSRRRCRKSWASARSSSRSRGGRTGAAAPGSRVQRAIAAWPDIAKAIGLPGSKIQSASVDLWGWRARVRLARGQTIADVTARIPAIESALGTYRGAVRVYPTGDGKANRCELRVLDTDPHAEAVPWPGPSARSITQPVDLGPFEDAEPCRVSFLRRHAPVRRHDRVGQERRAQRPHGHPRRLRRRGHLGHRPQEGDGTAALGAVHRPARHHARARPPRCSPTRSRSCRPAPRTWPRPAAASGNRPRTCPRWSSSSTSTPNSPTRHPRR